MVPRAECESLFLIPGSIQLTVLSYLNALTIYDTMHAYNCLLVQHTVSTQLRPATTSIQLIAHKAQYQFTTAFL